MRLDQRLIIMVFNTLILSRVKPKRGTAIIIIPATIFINYPFHFREFTIVYGN